MAKKVIKIKESVLRQMVSEAISNYILNEGINELHTLTADSAWVNAKRKYDALVANGQGNTPQAAKLKRQMDTFAAYNELPNANDLDTKNAYGVNGRKMFTDVANAHGIENYNPDVWLNGLTKYNNNNGQYDGANLTPQELNQMDKFNQVNYYQTSQGVTPQEQGYTYVKGTPAKKGGLFRKSSPAVAGHWQYNGQQQQGQQPQGQQPQGQNQQQYKQAMEEAINRVIAKYFK